MTDVQTRRKALIVGGSRGIGKALSEKLATDHHIWMASRDPDSEAGDRWIQWDATAGAFPEGSLPDRLDALAYCPGNIRLAPFARLTDDMFQKDFQINLLGAVRALRAALPSLRVSEDPAVVLFSTVAVTTGMPMHASVAAAKGAVEGLTRALAAEFAPRIRVNAIAPSITDTSLSRGLLRSEKQQTAANERHPMGRIGDAGDIASAAAYLLSREAGWVTGQVIHVDGGLGSLLRFR